MSQFGKSAEFDDIILAIKRCTLQGPFYQFKDMKKIKSFLVPFSISLLFFVNSVKGQEYISENLFYLINSPDGYESFVKNADQISIVCPAAYSIDSVGVISGKVDRRVLETAQQKGVKVMPLFASFDQKGIHDFLNNAAARKEAIRLMLFYANQFLYYGWQMDLENIYFADKDAYTSFFQQSADSLHHHGLIISMAIVKSNQPAPETGNIPYQLYLYENWSGAFDIRAIAAASDFISFMTYDQHIAYTPPGPVAGMPWFKGMLKYLVDLKIPLNKISLGIPVYSDYWFPSWNKVQGGFSTRDEISYTHANDLMDEYHAKPKWMVDQQINYTWWEEAGVFNWLFLEDAKSFLPKFMLAKEQHLRGISVWVLGTEDPEVWNVLKREARAKRIQ
jgi:spore germination protein YaaH